jgi:peptidoglycan/xylan/chitin deacetylase (PgdA/CDA1 family)
MHDASLGVERINWPERPVLGPAGEAPRPPRRPRVTVVLSWVLGLLMLPLSVLPFLAYAHFDRTGNLLLLRVERYFADPAAPALPPGEAAAYAATALHYRDALAVLALPEVIDGPGHPGALSPARFARDVRMLEAAGYHAVAPEQVVSWLDGKTVLPENAVLLTFDAARADVVLNAAPVLKDVDMRATVFPVGGAYEKNPVWFSSPEQLRELEGRFGWSIGAFAAQNHGEIAVDGGSAPYLSALEPGEDLDAVRARARDEYAGALRVADDIGARPAIAYAWPYGAWGGDRRSNDPGIGPINLEEARKVFRLGFTLDAQESFRLLTRGDDPMRVARLAVSAEWTPAELLERLNVAAASSAPVLDRATS